MKQIEDYIVATSTLYGLVSLEKVADIYRAQNNEELSVGELRQFAEREKGSLQRRHVYVQEGHFVHEAAVGEEDMLQRKQGDKPYYVPEKDELLRYTDDHYFEKNYHYLALESFLKERFKSNPGLAEEAANDVHDDIQAGGRLQTVMDTLTMHGVEYKNDEEISQVVQLVTDLFNNVRLWENRGHTPDELHQRFEKPHLKPLPGGGGKVSSKLKVGRNDPCPCGSGKKYKKCCLA